jgi:hypothetical protein
VLPLAVVMAYADGFWMISLRGAVGSVEHAREPFSSWVQESTLSVPLFVLAVLGALMLARHWFGRSPARRGRTLVLTGLLVAAAGTLAGMVELAGNAAYDYHLQSGELAMMDAMRGSCAGACHTQQLHATLGLDARAAVYGSGIILVSNLVLVGWVVALRGGRLDVVAPSRRLSHGRARPVGRLDDLRLVLAAGLVGSGVVHAAVVPEHLDEWRAAGVFFALFAAAQVVVAGLVLARQRRAVLQAAAALSVGPLVLWAYSRTAGLPFGPEPGVAEQVGLADLAASALEIATLILAVMLLRARTRGATSRPPAAAHASRLAVVAVVAVTAVGLGGSGVTWLDVRAPGGEPMSTTAP